MDIVWNHISVRSNNYTILQCSFCLVVLISIVFLPNRCTGHCWSIDIWSFFIHTRWYKDATVHDESESCSPRRHNCCCCRWCCVHAFSWQSKQEVLNNSVFPRAEFEFWPSSVESNICYLINLNDRPSCRLLLCQELGPTTVWIQRNCDNECWIWKFYSSKVTSKEDECLSRYNKWTGPFGWVLGVKENYLPRAAYYILQAFFLYFFSEDFNGWQTSAEHCKTWLIYPPLSSRCTSCLQPCINLLWFIFIQVLKDHHRENKRLVSRLKGA